MANDPRGRVYDIEAQVSREPRIGRRMRYYQSAMDVSELGRGDGVADLPESYIVFFCQRDPFGLALPSYTVERVCAEAPALDVGSGSHWLALNAQAWEAAAGDPLGEVLEYVGKGRATGPLTARIDGLVEEFNDDEGWVRRLPSSCAPRAGAARRCAWPSSARAPGAARRRGS